mmetsp:Transcript_1980/g.5887  ORF Transcript_1980/g.5887 Transcript_1980/m.5887 type:complete len:214 (+) Transcript_1980:2399-3040(+)
MRETAAKVASTGSAAAEAGQRPGATRRTAAASAAAPGTAGPPAVVVRGPGPGADTVAAPAAAAAVAAAAMAEACAGAVAAPAAGEPAPGEPAAGPEEPHRQSQRVQRWVRRTVALPGGPVAAAAKVAAAAAVAAMPEGLLPGPPTEVWAVATAAGRAGQQAGGRRGRMVRMRRAVPPLLPLAAARQAVPAQPGALHEQPGTAQRRESQGPQLV